MCDSCHPPVTLVTLEKGCKRPVYRHSVTLSPLLKKNLVCNFVTQKTLVPPFTLCLAFKDVTKSMVKYRFPVKKFGRFNKKHYLCTHQNPPSLSARPRSLALARRMLKCAGRFIFQKQQNRRPNIDFLANSLQVSEIRPIFAAFIPGSLWIPNCRRVFYKENSLIPGSP